MRPNTLSRDLIKEFLSYVQVEKGLSRNTLQSYSRDLARLDQWARKSTTPVQNLSRQDLRHWIADLSREGLAPSSVARAVSAARGFFRFLMLDGHIKRHPTEELDTPQRFAYLPQFLTVEEIDKLFAAPDISTEGSTGSPASTSRKPYFPTCTSRPWRLRPCPSGCGPAPAGAAARGSAAPSSRWGRWDRRTGSA